jgi:recombination protein RecR
LPPSVTRLIDAFSQLPGIGPKSASRLAYYLLRQPAETSQALAEALRGLKAHTRLCADAARDHGLLCVVEEPLDVAAIERSRAFKGLYHVLHGVMSPINGVGPDEIKISELLTRIQRAAASDAPVREVILATNPTVEGEQTAAYIQRKIAALPGAPRITRLARGLPVGGDLEYADEVTLSRALDGRQSL